MNYCRSWNGPGPFLRRNYFEAFHLRQIAMICLCAVPLLTVFVRPAAAMSSATDAPLPDAPQPNGKYGGSLSGKVLDTTGAPVAGAEVTLRGKNPPVHRTMAVDNSGAFTFAGLAAETYTVTVRAPGMEPVAPMTVPLGEGEAYKLPITAIPLPKFNSTVQVTANPVEIATAQVHEEEKQRVLAIVPNFYTSYVWNAAPLTTKLKYRLMMRSIFDPFTITAEAAVAGMEQANNTYPGYGTGIEGYAKRFGSSYTDAFVANFLGNAVLASAFHQDPRYFYRGSGSVMTRLGYALKESVMTRGDNGKQQVAYASLLGDFLAAGISNAYHAPQDRTYSITFRDAGVIAAAGAGENILREFLSRTLTSNVPKFENGKSKHPAK